MEESRIDIIGTDSPGIFFQELDEDFGIDTIFDDLLEIDVDSTGVVIYAVQGSDHGLLTGLGDDDHPQYYNQARGDARYEKYLNNPTVDDYILSSKVDGTRAWIAPPVAGGGGTTDHGLLEGLGDDDHVQYHNTARADAWLAGKTIDHGGLGGLTDDDHPQYHNNARGDARYSQLGHTHAAVNMTNFTIMQENGKLVVKYGSTVILSIASNGLITSANDVVAFGTP